MFDSFQFHISGIDSHFDAVQFQSGSDLGETETESNQHVEDVFHTSQDFFAVFGCRGQWPGIATPMRPAEKHPRIEHYSVNCDHQYVSYNY